MALGPWQVLAVIAIGLAVGASELVGRYRDAPSAALRTYAAAAYMIINGMASLFAYAVIVAMGWSFGVASGPQQTWTQILVAGFGSMAFFRSSLFTVKVGDTDLSVGPGILFQLFLFATDRSCDRQRARRRADPVAEIMRGISFPLAKDALPTFCFELMQNVPVAEQQGFRQVVDAMAAKAEMRDGVKVLSLGLMLMNVVGGDVLKSAVATLGNLIQEPARPRALESETSSLVLNSDFTKAYPLLVQSCLLMASFDEKTAREQVSGAVLAEMDPIAANTNLDNSTKMVLLALALQRRVGDAVLRAALGSIADGIALAKPPAPVQTPVVQLHQDGAAS